ncbi:MAG: FAD-dependent oxidoreductase, partial [Pseudomonadales bacterium]|nr:FAD-dependent oxidoreductase [Pseudomonadales bacterium]
MQKEKIVIVGNGPVAHKFIEVMLASGKEDQYDITVIGEESLPAYNRVYLTAWFETRDASGIEMGTSAFYADNKINCLTSEKITEIDRAGKSVKAESGNEYAYDTLILATGSFPFVPPVPGHDRKNTFVYRTIDDLEAITEAAKTAKIGTVVGGGLLGLEAAKALHDLELKTHVVEFAPRLMAVQVDEGGGNVLKGKIQDLGVGVHTQKNTKQIVDGDECVHRMEFADGENLETDIIVFSAGIRPQDALARQSDLEIGERGGIVIDNFCKTS